MKLQKAHTLMAMTQQLDSRDRREPIPQEVKIAVWRRHRQIQDRGDAVPSIDDELDRLLGEG